MPGVTIDQLQDLLKTTLENLPSGEFEVALKYQSYPVCDKWFRRDRRRLTSGTSISRRIQLKTNGSARHVALYEPTPNNQVDTMAKIDVDWVYTEAKMHYEAHELTMNRSPSKLVDLIKERRVAAYMDLADLIENDLWQTPQSSSDTRSPLGVPYWLSYVSKGTVDYTGGFNGTQVVYGDGTTSNSIGGIDATLPENSRWANWCANITGMNMSTIDTLRRAIRRVKFRPPENVRDLYRVPSSRMAIYSNQDYADEYERLVNAGPDNRNGDLNRFYGDLYFKGIPWIAVPALDSNAYRPIFGINHQYFFPYILGDWWLKEDKPIRDRGQRLVFTVGVDCAYQTFCLNRRAGGFVLSDPVV